MAQCQDEEGAGGNELDDPVPPRKRRNEIIEVRPRGKAEGELKKVVSLSSRHAQALIQLADLYLTQKKYAQAREQVKAIMSWDSKNFQANTRHRVADFLLR